MNTCPFAMPEEIIADCCEKPRDFNIGLILHK